MPIFFILFVILAIYVAFQPGAAAGYHYIFRVDKAALLDPKTWIFALGQAFFSLSVAGNGTLIYGSYLSDEEDIPASARILCIADSFDAMTSKRCYKELMPAEKALRIIREEEGKQFDPDMAEVFIHIFREGKIHLAEPAELKREEKA